MPDIDVDKLIEVLPKLVRENDAVKGAIITALTGVVATRDDIRDLIAEMDRRFGAMEKRFEAMEKRFEAMEKRFESLQVEMDRRFEAMEKRFESLQVEMDRRFEAMQAQMDRRFERTDAKIDAVLRVVKDIKRQMGAPFEQFARNVVSRIL
ncbi:MAG: hypothetical protein ACTSU5_18825, partial [Promethearchaeota archaeon]